MAELKTRPTKVPVREFIRTIDDPVRRRDCEQLRKMMAAITGKRAVMWGDSIVGFGKYSYRYGSGWSGEFFVTGFSPRKKDLTVYVMPGFGPYESELEKIGRHRLGKSCLYLKGLEGVDLEALAYIVSDSVNRMKTLYDTNL